MAYSFKQRKDGGFDFFDATGKKTNIESYTKNTGANINQLRQKLATQGDTQSQRIVAGLPTQFRAPTQQQSTPSVFNTPIVRTPTMSQTVSQPTIQAPKVYTPKAQQAYVDAKIIGTGSPNEVKQAITRTVDRKNSVKLDPQFKQGKSYEDIARDAGFSIDEVKRYAERNHKGYGDLGLIGNAARATGQFVGTTVDNGVGIVRKPISTLALIDSNNQQKINDDLSQINKDLYYRNITPQAAQERASALTKDLIGMKATQDQKTGMYRLGDMNTAEFTGQFAQQGIDTYSVLPIAGGAASGASKIAQSMGQQAAQKTLEKTAAVLTAGAQTQATSKLAQSLAAKGMNPQAADILGNAITSNAKQSLVYGTAQTGADVASGRGVTPESLAMNYGADFLMGAVPEIGISSIGRGIDLNNAKVHQELVRTNPTYKANTDKLTAIDATIARAQANGDVRALEGLQAVKAQLSDSNALIARRYAEQGFLGGKNATGFKDAEARGEVFTDTPDGLPRFEVSDENMKIKNPNGKTLGELIDHPKLFENYPQAATTKVVHDPTIEGNGFYNEKTDTIYLNSTASPEKALNSILHETQHQIQGVEGFARGTTPEAAGSFAKYKKTAGEAEADAVASRRTIPQSELYADGKSTLALPKDLTVKTSTDKANYITKGRTPSKIHPEDQTVMAKLIDYARGYGQKLSDNAAHELQIDAARIAERYGIDVKWTKSKSPLQSLADAFDKRLMGQKYEGVAMSIEPTKFESDLRKAGLGVEPDAYRKQPKDVKKAIDAYIANEYPQLAYALDSKLHFPDGIPKVRPEDVKRITGLTPREAGIPPIYVSRNATPIDKLAVEYEITVRGNTSGELKMTSEDFLDTMMDAIEANRSVGQQTKLIRELRNNPDVIAKARATLEAERAQYGAPETTEPSKRDLREYEKMMANDASTSQEAPRSKATQNSKRVSAQSPQVQANRKNQGPSNRSAQSQGRVTPTPDSKAPTDRTFSDNTPPIDTKQYIKELSKEQGVAGKGKVSVSDKAADFKEKFIDDLSPIEDRLNKAIKAGAEVDPKDHITYQLDRSRRSEGITQAYMNDNGLAKIIQEVPNPKEFDQYLIARHAAELDPEITTGRNKAKDAALVKQLDGKYGEYAKRVYAYTQKLLDTSVEYGLISKDTAAMLKKKYPEYVPLNRIFNEDELVNLQGTGKGNASISAQGVVKKLQGSKRSVRSPLNSIIDKTRVVVEQGERNRAAKMLASYKNLPGNPFNLKEIKASETIGNRHTIAFLDNGKKRVFEVDKEISDAAKNMNRQEIGLWGRIAAAPARVLRAGATGVNAGFAGANVVKDIVGAAINSKHPVRIADPKAVGKALASALNRNGKYYQELMREGVAGTSFDMYRNPLKSNIGEIRSQKNLATRVAYNVTHPKQWYRTVENTIGRSEDFGRALQYYSNKSGFEAKYGKGSKTAKILAADQARNNSTNFFRHGSYGKNINLAIPYWNAGVQGARIQTRRLIERPAQTVAKIGLAIAAPSAMIAVNNYSDETKRRVMEDIEDYEKEGNIIIVGNDAKFNEKTGRWDGVYKIPVPPQHLGIHKSIQDAVKSAYTGEDYDIIGNLGKITENYTTIDPTDPRAVANKYTPQGVKLIAEPMTNTNFFTGNKIVPDSQKNLPAVDQYGDYTSGTAKTIGKLTNTSPRMIDNTIRTGTGGVGRSITTAIDDTTKAENGGEKGKAALNALLVDPVTKRFSGAQALSASSKADKQFEQLKKQVIASNTYKNASAYDKSRMLNRLQSDISAVEYNKAGKDSDKLTKKQTALASGDFKVETYTNLNSSVTPISAKTPASAKSILETYDSLDTEARKKWSTEKNTDTAVTKSLQAWLGDKVKIPEVTNDVAKEWADFQNDYADGKISKLKENDQKKAILKKAFNSQLSTDEKEIHTLTKTELQYYYDNGVITDENINKAIAVEKQLFEAGLITRETLQRNLGLSARGYKTSSGSSGRKTSTKTASKASIAELFASQKQINDINNSTYLSLSRLLGSVSSGSSKMAKNKIGREVTLKKITGAKA